MTSEASPSRWVLLAVGAVIASLTAAWAATGLPDHAADLPAGQVVPVEVTEVPLVCPPGIVDAAGVLAAQTDVTSRAAQSGAQSGGVADTPSSLAAGGERIVWASGTAQPLDGGADIRLVDAQDNDEALAGLTVSGVGEGDLLSLSAQTCVVPSRKLAFAAGSTVVGEDAVLIISNPAEKPTSISIEMFGEDGDLLVTPATLTVGAMSTAMVLPGTWSPGAASPAILVTAEGAGVAAWLQTSALDGEVPLGLDTVQAMTPQTSVVLTGVTASRESTLRIGNVGSSRTEVDVTMLTDSGEEPLEGAQGIPVPANSTVSVDLAALPSEVHALLVEADQELVAAVTETTPGTAHPDVRDATYFARTVVGASRSLTSSPLVTAGDLSAFAERLGFTDLSVSVAVSNPGADPVELEVQGATKTLPAKSSALFPLLSAPDQSGFHSEQPVYAAYVFTATTPAGTVRSVAGLGVEGILAQSRAVRLFPLG